MVDSAAAASALVTSGYGSDGVSSRINSSSMSVTGIAGGLFDATLSSIARNASSHAIQSYINDGDASDGVPAPMLMFLFMDTTDGSTGMDTTVDDFTSMVNNFTIDPNDTDIKEDMPNLFLFVTYGLLTTFIGLMGLAGNILSIIVLSRPQMKSSINCCLIGLATFDSLVLVCSSLMFGINNFTLYTNTFVAYNEIIYPYIIPHLVYPVGLIAQTGSVWVTVTVTIERYVAVCLPLKAKSLCTYGRARVYIVAIAIFSVVYNLPRFWEVERVSLFNNETNETIYYVDPSNLRKNPIYVQVYINWMYLFVLYFVPFVTLALLNGHIWFKVKEANRERQKLSRLQQKEMGLAIMLFCVVVVFFICNLLALLTNMLEMNDIILDELTVSSNLLVTINSSVNFVIYCIFGQKFRRILLRTVCSCLPAHFRRGRFSRASEMEENTYPVSSTCCTAETTLLVHYNGHGTGNAGCHTRHMDRVSRSPSTGISFRIDSNRSTPSPIQRSSSHLGYLNIEFRPSSSSSSSLSANHAERSNSLSTAYKCQKPPGSRRHSSRLSLKWTSNSTFQTPS